MYYPVIYSWSQAKWIWYFYNLVHVVCNQSSVNIYKMHRGKQLLRLHCLNWMTRFSLWFRCYQGDSHLKLKFSCSIFKLFPPTETSVHVYEIPQWYLHTETVHWWKWDIIPVQFSNLKHTAFKNNTTFFCRKYGFTSNLNCAARFVPKNFCEKKRERTFVTSYLFP